MNNTKLEKKAAWLRRVTFEMLASAQQGHPGGVLSEIDILVALFYGGVIRVGNGNRVSALRDKIIISKGHATMGLYPILADLGFFDKSELKLFGKPEGMLRIFGNIDIPGIDATTGSLGHGPGIGIGYALAAKYDNLDQRVFVIISEGEMYEGSVWESALFASHNELDNLIVIVDRNDRIILGGTEDLLALEPMVDKWRAFGFDTERVDGHCFSSLLKTFDRIGKTDGKPIAIIADTIKGKGIPSIEGNKEWHYWQTLPAEEQAAISEDLIIKERSFSE